MNKSSYPAFKKKLEEELKTTQDEIKFLEESDNHRHYAENTVDELDEDFASNERERMGDQQMALWITRRKNIHEALKSIEKGTYGICQECKKEIQPKRLEAIPYAPYCIECEEKFELKHQVTPEHSH